MATETGTKPDASPTGASGFGPEHERPAAGPRGAVAVIASVLTVAIVAAYIFVSAAFTLPESPARPAVSAALSPFFSQRWNVFAPNIMKVNSELQIQVQWREDGELVHSDWVDVTDIEFAAGTGTPAASRITKSSFNATQTYLARYRDLNSDQQERVGDTFIRALGGGEFSPMAPDDLVDEIDALGNDRAAVIRFLRYDYMLVRFASAFGTASYDRDVERVRWRVEQDRPNDFAHRFEDTRQYEVSYRTFGWRQPAVAPASEVVAIYDDVIERYSTR